MQSSILYMSLFIKLPSYLISKDFASLDDVTSIIILVNLYVGISYYNSDSLNRTQTVKYITPTAAAVQYVEGFILLFLSVHFYS